ncbi:MAG: hypothetical protein V8S22_05865 [Lachnospiraceae bacterium]
MVGAIVDDDLAHAAILDANFEENWGGCLYLSASYSPPWSTGALYG